MMPVVMTALSRRRSVNDAQSTTPSRRHARLARKRKKQTNHSFVLAYVVGVLLLRCDAAVVLVSVRAFVPTRNLLL